MDEIIETAPGEGYHDPVYEDPGDSGNSAFSLDYYRDKAREFQETLNAIDITYNAITTLLASDISDELRNDLTQSLMEFDSKKSQFRLTAEAINAGAAIVNSLGGRFPVLSIPGNLGIFPIAVPVAVIAAVGTAATLALWGSQWISGLNERLKLQMLLDAQNTPEAKAALAKAIADTELALKQSESSIWSTLGSAVKWIGLGVVAYLAYREYTKSKGD